jgi:uncharacterized protein YcbK (DUF882 family)
VLVGGARLRACRIVATRACYSCGLAVLLLLFAARVLQNAIAEGDTRTISLHHIHTGEDITITFKRDGRYDEAALEKLNWFLRDWRRQQQTRMDPHLIDLIWEVHRETGSNEPIWVVCGYRSPETNAMLRRRSGGVARFSQHMLGHAMDFYIPGVRLEDLRVIGLRLQRGGVGFYPTSGSPFVHMDTGGVRHWPRMTREQLVRIFPDGRTVHIPTDGRPLAGYAFALADIQRRGGSPSEMSLEAARSAGVHVADLGSGHHRANPIAKFFGLAHDDEDDDANAPAAAATASNLPTPTAAEPLRKRAKAVVVAAIDRAEDKMAVEKAKLVKVASKVHVISRAEAAPLAAPTPNQIILARGYWLGVADSASAAQLVQASANPLAADARTPRVDLASAEAEATGATGPFSLPRDSGSPDAVLAYTEQTGSDASPRAGQAGSVTSVALPQLSAPRIVPIQTADNETTIAIKRVEGRTASTILTVADKKLATPLSDAARLNDPWLRALLVSPGVSRTFSVTPLGARDFRALAALMVKPDNSVMMTFTSDPNAGLADDHFSGSAIVFVSTVSYPMHTAGLQ